MPRLVLGPVLAGCVVRIRRREDHHGGRHRALRRGLRVDAAAADHTSRTHRGGIVGLVIGLIVVGLVSGLVNVGLLTLRQRRTDPEQLGRVLAVSISLNILGMPIGSAVGGFVIERSSALAFVVAGVAAALGAAAMWVMVPNHAR